MLETLKVPARYASADQRTLRGPQWVAQQWDAARREVGSGDGVVTAIEVTTGRVRDTLPGMDAFVEVEAFLMAPVERWVGA